MGTNDTKSESAPLTPEQRKGAFNAGMESFYNSAPGLVSRQQIGGTVQAPKYSYTLNTPEYTKTQLTDPGAAKGGSYTDPGAATSATFTDPGAVKNAKYTDVGDAKTLSGGDYDRLEQSIIASRLAPLERAWALRKGDINQEMADRGMWSSGAPIQVQNREFEQSFLPQYTQAGAEAATQRYGAQANELNALNQFALARTGEKNQFALTDSDNQNRYALARADAANQFGLTDAAAKNQFALSRANDANQFSLSDAANQNQYGLSRAGMLNEANMTEQDRAYQAKWRPLDFAQGLYNNTGGVVSSSAGGGWSI